MKDFFMGFASCNKVRDQPDCDPGPSMHGLPPKISGFTVIAIREIVRSTQPRDKFPYSNQKSSQQGSGSSAIKNLL
jgi:hypothetical protein